MTVQPTPYGSLPVAAAPDDVSGRWTYSVDLRRETGRPDLPDESGWQPPGTCTVAVFPTLPGHHPVGEVRLILDGQEVRLVGQRTGRGLVEVTTEEVRAMRRSPEYAAQMRRWLRE